ncbi:MULTISPECIES: DUF1206 domain-containing protein [unclassified Rhizobium]|uniref:DUF1206 domain-containing protein n=1 Tax=unclassified Rhizobium TaxID=2613769 RepID=UPI0006FF622F|nr:MULTISPECIES: DUF1206 domain-containing protein [unclassified Rhizobium]KQV36725.1 hypothetical protein ASC86_24595 [Rhizobium sp. Root1212]KRD28543.1 hypothetical protein ASE37_24360 [Rhizobium sp. Root268]
MASGSNFELLARVGYAARGVVFILVSGLALFSGFGGGGPEAKSALQVLLDQPLGRVWVFSIGLGLLGFVSWRLAQSLADADRHGAAGKGLLIRAALFGSALTYTSLAFYALGQATLFAGGQGGSGEKDLASWMMSQPFGSYLAIFVGLGFVAGGVVTAAKGTTGKFERYLQNLPEHTVIRSICVYGLVARGIVFALVGVLFVYAGKHVNPDEAGSTADALNWLRQLPFGSLLYVAVALGLAAFGAYNFVEARYRVVKVPSIDDTRHALKAKLK